MGVRSIKPTTPANRFSTRPDFAEITKSTPEKSLTTALRKTGGRNNKGRITVICFVVWHLFLSLVTLSTFSQEWSATLTAISDDNSKADQIRTFKAVDSATIGFYRNIDDV